MRMGWKSRLWQLAHGSYKLQASLSKLTDADKAINISNVFALLHLSTAKSVEEILTGLSNPTL